MRLSDFSYELPPELIAQHPVQPRDAARMMVVDRATGDLQHRTFTDLPDFLRPGDVVVVNDTRVIPARLHGRKPTGGAVELLLLRPAGDAEGAADLDAPIWEALVRPGRGVRSGTRLRIGTDLTVEVLDVRGDGVRIVRIGSDRPLRDVLQEIGEMPLPPYVHESLQRPGDYQTIYAAAPGAVAAPTAGLHFTEALLARIGGMDVRVASITMHIGLGTFRAVTTEQVADHRMDAEWYEVRHAAAEAINGVRQGGGRVVVVGTSGVRTLETVKGRDGTVRPGTGWSTLFIYPGFAFGVTDALVTNFHLPKTTLLMLVSAFAGRELVRRAYREAIAQHYRFYSFGDAMLIL